MKITTKKRLEKALKIGAVVLAALVLLVLLVGVGASCIKDRYKNRELITCAAEEASTTTEETRTIYPSENLIPYPYVDKSTTINGVTFTVNNDGTVNVNGTATARCDFSLSNYVPVTVGASYFFSGCPIGGGSDTFIFYLYDGVNGFADKGEGKKVIARNNFFVLKIIVYTGATVDNLVFKPMLNVGDVAYPFIPNLDGVRQDGYNNGYDIGRQDGNEVGYDNGYNDGYETGVEDGGLFGGVSVSSTYFDLTTAKESSVYTTSPRKNSYGLDFDFIADYWDTQVSDVSNVILQTLIITFEKPIPYYHYTFRRGSTSSDIAFTVVGEDNTTYLGGFTVVNGVDTFSVYADDLSKLKTLNIKELRYYKTAPLFAEDMRSLSLTYEDVAYNNGYAVGKQEGEENAVFTFDNLKSGFFSILDAPFKTIKDALNFEFLGINISNLVLFLLTVIVVVIIIKKAVGK